MRPPDPCTDVLTRLDAYLDGDLAPADARAFVAHCASCPACAEELALARAVAEALEAWTAPPCPDRVTRAAFAEIRRRRARSAVDRLRSWGVALRGPALRPALGLAAAALVALSVALFRSAAVDPAAVDPVATDPAGYTQAEIDQAVADVHRTLAILGDVGHRTGLIVRDDVLEPHVIRPVRHTVGEALDP